MNVPMMTTRFAEANQLQEGARVVCQDWRRFRNVSQP